METRGLSDSDAIGLLVESVIGRMFFSRPGIIKQFYPTSQRADVVVGIKYKKPVKDGKSEYEELPLILNVPIAMQYSPEAGLASTFPIRENDPCTLIFSDRMINQYIQKREISLPEEVGTDNVTTQPRQHKLEDAMCFPGVICKRDILPNWNNDAWEIRNKDRSSFISLGTDTNINMHTTGKIKMSAPDIHMTTGSADIRIKDGKMWTYADDEINRSTKESWTEEPPVPSGGGTRGRTMPE